MILIRLKEIDTFNLWEEVKVSLKNINEIRDLLLGKVLNKVTLSFYVNDFDNIYKPHDLLRLVKLENGLTLLS